MAEQSDAKSRRFLFLQGPHGPFFAGLGDRLRSAGASVIRVGFNAGDGALWRGPGYVAFRDPPAEWPEYLSALLDREGITDLVCYGGSRPVHAEARREARARGLTTHVLEEGYLRPYWITYERGGTNAHSPLMEVSLADMERAISADTAPPTEAPDRWGDMRAHMFWGAVYHGLLMAGSRRYPGFRPHRAPGVGGEFRLHALRLIEQPAHVVQRALATARVRYGGFPYHLALLQLAHDANFRDNGPFPDQAHFLETVFRGFAEGAPAHHHLVLKAHPLEDGREPLRPLVRALTQTFALTGRVHFVSGGKLAQLLDSARSAVTVNSTSAEQALWRGLPLRAFGRAVYNRPEFVSDQPVDAFFRDPKLPDRTAYMTYRSFLLASSQVPGGFYGLRNRRKLLRQLPDLMLTRQSPYERLLDLSPGVAAGRQHLAAVS